MIYKRVFTFSEPLFHLRRQTDINVTALSIKKINIINSNNILFNFSTNTSLKDKLQEKIAALSQQQKKYVMPQKVEVRMFKPKRPVSFHQGRALIYFNKQNLLTPNILPMYIIAPMIYLGYLIKTNPFYLTFPAALPIMGMLEILLLFRWAAHKKHNKYQIERVYLTENGEGIQIWLANKIRRKLKNTHQNLWLNIQILKSPPDQQNYQPKRGVQFPTDLSYIRKPSIFNYGWSKYDQKYQVYVFPKNYQYANWQLLVPVFNGIRIDTSQCPKTQIPIDELRKMPTMEQAEQEIQRLKISQAEWQKNNGKLFYTRQEAKKWI